MSEHPNIVLADATVVIVGVGLLGGSLGLALRGSCTRRIGVVAPGDQATAERALALDVVDEVGEVGEQIALADIVVLATPVREIVRLVPEIAALMRPGAVLTDLGSTKAAIVESMERTSGIAWAGGHPMCGGVDVGVEFARPDLFTHAAWAICSGTPAGVACVREIAEAVGARPVEFEPAAHDRAVAHVSHLPYAVAQALMHLVAADGEPGGGVLASTGFAGATRMAAGDTRMWADILHTNRSAVVDALDGLGAQLGQLRALVTAGDDEALVAWLARGAADRRE